MRKYAFGFVFCFLAGAATDPVYELLDRGYSQLRQKDYLQAIQCFEKAATLSPRRLASHCCSKATTSRRRTSCRPNREPASGGRVTVTLLLSHWLPLVRFPGSPRGNLTAMMTGVSEPLLEESGAAAGRSRGSLPPCGSSPARRAPGAISASAPASRAEPGLHSSRNLVANFRHAADRP